MLEDNGGRPVIALESPAVHHIQPAVAPANEVIVSGQSTCTRRGGHIRRNAERQTLFLTESGGHRLSTGDYAGKSS